MSNKNKCVPYYTGLMAVLLGVGFLIACTSDTEPSSGGTGVSSDATLSALTLSGGATLSPAFATGTTRYTASVANSVTSITVTPTANHGGATIKVNTVATESGAVSGGIALSEGNTTISIVVTAADATTTQTYTVTVTRDVNNAHSDYTINSALCDAHDSLNCTQLRLGDDYHTTSQSQARVGYLYSCDAKNPRAGGSDISKLSWINFITNTWNFLAKLWLPEGDFNPTTGTFSETTTDTQRILTANNLPVDRKIGDWPMTDYAPLTDIDGNPGVPSSQSFTLTVPRNPTVAADPSCVALGPIGITLNGVVLYHAADGRGNDAVAHEIVDEYGGHPAKDEYHYHFLPERLDSGALANGHSQIVGYIRDGFPLYGYKGVGGTIMTNSDLDLCHGHDHDTLGYHYHATLEYPYTVGCYKGTPAAN